MKHTQARPHGSWQLSLPHSPSRRSCHHVSSWIHQRNIRNRLIFRWFYVYFCKIIRGIILENSPLFREGFFRPAGKKWNLKCAETLKNELKTLKKPAAGRKILGGLTIMENPPLVSWGSVGAFSITIPLISAGFDQIETWETCQFRVPPWHVTFNIWPLWSSQWCFGNSQIVHFQLQISSPSTIGSSNPLISSVSLRASTRGAVSAGSIRKSNVIMKVLYGTLVNPSLSLLVLPPRVSCFQCSTLFSAPIIFQNILLNAPQNVAVQKYIIILDNMCQKPLVGSLFLTASASDLWI